MATFTATTKGPQKLYGFYGNGNGAVYTITATNGTGVMKKFDVIRRPIRGGIPNVVSTGGSGQVLTYTEPARFDFELEVWADVITVGTFTATVGNTGMGDNIALVSYALDANGNPVGLQTPGGGVGFSFVGGMQTGVANATTNTTALQLALNNGGMVKVDAPGTYYTNATISIPDNTTLSLAAGVTIKASPTMGKVMFVNSCYTASPTTIGAGTLTSLGLVATLAETGIGTKYPLDSFISVQGSTDQSYNGIWRVTVSSANSISYNLENLASASPAAGTVTYRNANTNISIVGEGVIDYDQATNSSASTLYDASAVIFFNCDTPKIQGVRLRNAKKYCSWFTATTNGIARDLNFNTASDGVHVCGPSRGVMTIERLSGYCGDDMVGLSNGDNTTGELSRGEISHVKISNITGEKSAIALVSIVGGGASTIRYKTVEIDGLYGTCGGPALNIYEYTASGATLTATYIENLVVRNIAPSSWSDSGCIYIGGSTTGCVIDSMTVENMKPAPSLTANQNAIQVDAKAIVKSLKVRGLSVNFASGSNGSCVSVTATATLNFANIDGFDLVPVTSARNAVISNVAGTTLGRINLSNGQSVANPTGYLIGVATSCDIYISNCYSSTTNSAVNVTVTGAVVNLYTSNWKNSAGTTTPIYAVSGATLNWFGNCDCGTAKGAPAAGSTFRANGNMRVDASLITTSVAGDTFYNTLTTWVSGTGTDKSGLYGYTGAAYTKVFGPA